MADCDSPGPLEADPALAQLETIKDHIKSEPQSRSGLDRPAQEWQCLAQIPTSEELNPDWDDPAQVAKITSVLLPNRVEAPWQDKALYLETHYRLQREESITMLRYSISKYKSNPAMEDDRDTCVYTKVSVQGYLMTRLGPMCRVSFSTERAGKRIRWTQTRRLTTGTLVALSTAKDKFRTICIPAVIADFVIRGGLDQSPPTIQIFWANPDDAVVDPSLELIMIESRVGYFESTRHTMVGLQLAAEENSPLDKYLVQADRCDSNADFVVQAPEMNLASLVHHVPGMDSISRTEAAQKMKEVKDNLLQYPVLGGIDDRLSRYTNLDNSQLTAVHRILTKELSIIQGPPGTGKTFTSVQSLDILLQSQKRGSSPIIVAAQTNHAVDQILMQLTERGYQIVRLGGRTRNEHMKEFSLYNLRRRTFQKAIQRICDRNFRNSEGAQRKNVASLQSIIEQLCPEGVLDPDQLLEAGIITQEQYDSLAVDDGWVNTLPPDFPVGIIAQWLGPEQLIRKPPADYKELNFTAEDEDNGEEGLWDEMEDAKEYGMELEDHADEEAESFAIRGTWVPISHTWTGQTGQGFLSNDFRIRKEMKRPNLWSIDTKFRGAVYRAWQAQLLERRATELRQVIADSKRITDNLKISRWYKDMHIIRNAQVEVIGCTTTGLTKYRGLLAALQPRTMLVEEAAETREANIISAIYPTLQQLILVGDHQQLVPHCDTRGLGEEPYNLRVSLFERLVKLEMPYTMLNMQRRMIPSLRMVLNEFYPRLQDHPVVRNPSSRPPIPGMATESYFFHHTWSEASDEDMSKFNILEAEMIMGFVHYLRMNGIHDSQVTILTFYRGQRKKILAEGRRKLFCARPFTNVYTVDSYQGEENDIIILSLVRSNDTNKQPNVGFLADQNRGVVSISRARRGFYIFGNMRNLLDASPESRQMWGKVNRAFKAQGRLGEDSRLPITCQKHGKTIHVSHPEDWVMNHGGCDQPCQEKLSCGHICERRCHPMDHELLMCQQPCTHVLRCGHRCQQICGKECTCDCPEFTGAYPHDEFKKEVTPGDQNRRRRGAPGGYQPPHIGGMMVAGSTNWASWNPRVEDEKAKRDRPQPVEGRPSLIDLPDESSLKVPKNGDVIVQEIYRPVTLTDFGERVVGERIKSTSSPDKPQVPTRNISEVEGFPKTSPDNNGQTSMPLAHSGTSKEEPSTHSHNQLEAATVSPEVSVLHGTSLHLGQGSDHNSGIENYSIGGPFSLLDEDIPHFTTHSPPRPYSPESIVPQYPSGIRDRMAALRLEGNGGAKEKDDSEPLIDL